MRHSNAVLGRWWLVGLAVFGGGASAPALDLVLDDAGVRVDAAPMGTFTIGYPELPWRAVAGRERTPTGVLVRYQGGGEAEVRLGGGGAVAVSLRGVPGEVAAWTCALAIAPSVAQGGRWKLGDSEENRFPAAAAASPATLLQLDGAAVAVRDAADRQLTLRFASPCRLSLKDLGQRAGAGYAVVAQVAVAAGRSEAALTFAAAQVPAYAPPAPQVDRFGQRIGREWPGKVADEADLRADVAADEAYYAGLPALPGDEFGGLPGSGERLGLQATGFFHLELHGGRWVLVDPAGNAFFHLGVCVMTPGDCYTAVRGREALFSWLPAADGPFASAFRPGDAGAPSFHLVNWIRKFGRPYDLESYQERMIARVRSWGFNSLGAFSPASPAVQRARMPYVAMLPIGYWGSERMKPAPGVGLWDPFDADNRAVLARTFAKALPERAEDPLLSGYFDGNEPHMEDIPKGVPQLDGSFACKRELAADLRGKYQTLEAFIAAWGAQDLPGGLGGLADARLVVRTRAAADDMTAFTGRFLEEHFRLVAETFRQHDRRHLLIGNRHLPWTINNEQVCRISGRYLDALSCNYYTDAVDKDLLGRIHRWSGGRPLILSEFYWTSSGDSGLRDFRAVADQRERGLMYRNYVEQAAALGFVVGVEWFTLVDQAVLGRWPRFNGECFNSGLLSVADRPYQAMLAGMRATHERLYPVWLDGAAPFAYDSPRARQRGIPPKSVVAPRALGPIALDGTSRNWPTVPAEPVGAGDLVYGNDAGGAGGSFRACWDDANLYLLVQVADPTPLRNGYHGAPSRLWRADSVQLFLGAEAVGEGGPLRFGDRHITYGICAAGPAPVFVAGLSEQPACPGAVVPAVDGSGYTLVAAVPWSLLGVAGARPDLDLRFDLSIADSDNGSSNRAQFMWNGTDRNSGDRSYWGRLRLMP
ncbi:MAG: hypothetical protein L6R48_10650 [Planctomycetes bacterium]|nr:hypothetical protein [Planctomycetota bacterium]